MIVKFKQVIDKDLLLGSVVPDVSKGIFNNEYVDIDISDGLYEDIEISTNTEKRYVSCAFSQLVNCLLRRKWYTTDKLNHPQYVNDMKELEANISKLQASKCSTGFLANGYKSVSGDSVTVGFNGVRLSLLSDCNTVYTIFADSVLNPTNFDFSEVPEDNRVKITLYGYPRIVRFEPHPTVIPHIACRPVQWSALATFVDSIVNASRVMDLESTIVAPMNIVGKSRALGKLFDLSAVEEEKIEYVPRSLEQLFQYAGYNGHFPLIDAVYGTKLEVVSTGNKLTEVSFLQMFVARCYPELHPMRNFVSDVTALPINQSFVLPDVDPIVLANVRDYMRELTFLYTTENKVIHNTTRSLDLANILDMYNSSNASLVKQ